MKISTHWCDKTQKKNNNILCLYTFMPDTLADLIVEKMLDSNQTKITLEKELNSFEYNFIVHCICKMVFTVEQIVNCCAWDIVLNNVA